MSKRYGYYECPILDEWEAERQASLKDEEFTLIQEMGMTTARPLAEMSRAEFGRKLDRWLLAGAGEDSY